MKSPVIGGLIIILVFLLAIPQTGDAGIIKRKGVKAAVTSADQSYELTYLPGLETQRRFGFNVGGFLEWFDLPYFSVITQAEYSQRGMGQEFNVTGPDGPEIIGTTTLYSRLDYFSIPILGKFRYETENFTPYLLAGPRIDHLLGYDSDQGAFNILYDAFDRTMIGGTFGIGIESEAIFSTDVLAEIRYNMDLSDSYKTDLARVSNNAVDLWIGIAF